MYISRVNANYVAKRTSTGFDSWTAHYRALVGSWQTLKLLKLGCSGSRAFKTLQAAILHAAHAKIQTSVPQYIQSIHIKRNTEDFCMSPQSQSQIDKTACTLTHPRYHRNFRGNIENTEFDFQPERKIADAISSLIGEKNHQFSGSIDRSLGKMHRLFENRMCKHRTAPSKRHVVMNNFLKSFVHTFQTKTLKNSALILQQRQKLSENSPLIPSMEDFFTPDSKHMPAQLSIVTHIFC